MSDNEWYSPPDVIEFARGVMGSIDLDPFSSPKANETVKAKTFYTIADNGFSKSWSGNVWLNPPFSAGMLAKVMSRLLEDTPPAVMLLCNFDASTKWCQRALRWFDTVGHFDQRLRFIPGAGQSEGNGPKRSQALFFSGKWAMRRTFADVFNNQFGFAVDLTASKTQSRRGLFDRGGSDERMEL